ncbi:ROK family protein [Ramlibacter pallidus]|uniref:ROK family protein n=1 Tax=Ramlibacter pallidus TaxID=2780087 RepID=A0ABR9RYV7_9BURK|nr:ROK family protein [Ramlibacter pallidus]MBE7366408.1 ROK family protein [Ramlibacter pallidus]
MNMLQTVFWSMGSSRHVLAGRLDCSKSKANALAAGLIEQGLLEETGLQPSSGGRRPETLQLARGLGVVIGVDLGATSLDVAVMRPDLGVLAHHGEEADVRAGPGVVLARVRDLMRELLARCGLSPKNVIGVGIGVPGPVDFASAQLVNPPLMPEWDSFSIRDYLGEAFSAPVFVDNDVNLMALGELWRLQRSLQNFMVIKVGTGIGCGIVCHGEVYRGANGSAGDVGHICVDQSGPRCHCGNFGCVEAMAAAPAITRVATEAAQAGESQALADLLRANGRLTAMDVGQASRNGDAAANAIIQRAGSLIGQMLASVVNFFNPSHVFIGGGVTQIGPLFLASVRQSVYHRSLALSTRHLEIQYTPLGPQAGLVGAGALAMQESLRLHGSRA